MRWRFFILLQIILMLIVGGLVYKHQNKVAVIKVPPVELAQWYKPENKRQVWLHTMFKLRRELQAVEFYAQQKDGKHLGEWTEQLNKNYTKISEMVPSWQKKLDMELMQALTDASAQEDYVKVLQQVDKLQKNCDSCHQDYQAITALTYRSPNFSSIIVKEDTAYIDHMDSLTKQVNQIKISAQDGMMTQALSSLTDLEQGMADLGETCVNCHKKDRRNYPNQEMTASLRSLRSSLETGTAKQQGRDLGTLAVLACARCHGTHRIVSGVKNQLINEQSLSKLMQH
jgi:cytochrome c556